MDSTNPWKLRAMHPTGLPFRPAVLAAFALVVLGWLAYQSSGALLLWRSLDRATTSLESAGEDLGSLQADIAESYYSATALQSTGSAVYRTRYANARQRVEADFARAIADLEADPAERDALANLRADAQPLFGAMDAVVTGERPMPAGAFEATETLALRVPRDTFLARLATLQSDIRERFYARRSDSSHALHSALVKLCWGAVGALVLAVVILLLLYWVANQHQATERGLASTEEQYRDLLEHSSEMIAVISTDGAYMFTNPAWQQRLGTALAALPAGEAARVRELTTRALKGERLENVPLRLTSAERRPLLVEATLTRRDGTGPHAVRWICRDVTAREMHELRVRTQLAVAQILGSEGSTEIALPLALVPLAQAALSDFADIWFVTPGEQTLQLAYIWSRNSSAQRAPANLVQEVLKGHGLPGNILGRSKGSWQTASENAVTFHPAGSEGLPRAVSGFGVPISFQGRVLGTMQFYYLRPVAREDALMELMETIGLALGQFFARCSREQQLEALHRQTDSVLNSVADGIIGMDDLGRTMFVNPAASTLLREPASMLQGADVHNILHGTRHCGPGCPLRKLLAAPDGGSGQDTIFLVDGTSITMEYTLSARNGSSGEVGRVLTLRDITERQALDRMKDEFVSTVSHELRTPLTSIRGALGLLDSGRMGEIQGEASKLLRIAVSNTDRLIRLINDILDLERMESGRAPLQVRTVDLAELMQQSVDTMRPMADSARVRLEFHAEQAFADADPDRMQQVFTNLLSNAIKFSPPETTVMVTVDAGENNIALAVRDQGRGIPLEKLESIFDRFQQVDATDSRQKGGTGLGLAICRTILQQHFGRIWADRNDGAGVTFRLLVPRVQPRAETPGALFPEATSGDTVLICDDDATTRKLVRACLEPHSYRVIEASTGEEAVTLAQQTMPSAILLDINLPRMNGWEVLHTLKSHTNTAGIPIVIVSVLPPAPTLDRTEGWLQKPFSHNSLVAELGRLLRDRPAGDINVLLVEDDLDLARVMSMEFSGSGLTLHHAPTLAEARRISERVRPDLLVLDLGLPDGNGMDLVEWLRHRFGLEHLPLVVYSGRDVTPEEQERIYEQPSQIVGKTRVPPQEIERLVLAMLRNSNGPKNDLTGTWDARAASF